MVFFCYNRSSLLLILNFSQYEILTLKKKNELGSMALDPFQITKLIRT